MSVKVPGECRVSGGSGGMWDAMDLPFLKGAGAPFVIRTRNGNRPNAIVGVKWKKKLAQKPVSMYTCR